MTLETHGGANESSPCSTGTEHTPFVVFNCVLLSLSLLLGVSGNVLVCWVVLRNKTLRTANNALLVNLAASDLLKCSVDTPVFLASLLWALGRGTEVSARLCCLLQFTYALCSCVQLLSLVGISVERFRAIAFPFRAETRRGRVRVWLLFIWALGLVLAVLSLTLSKDALYYMMCTHVRPHGMPNPFVVDPFGVFVLVPVWGCCLVLIAVHYLRIFVVVRQHSNKIFDRGVQLKHSMSRQVSGWQSFSQHAQQRPSGTLSKPCEREPAGKPSSSPEEEGNGPVGLPEMMPSPPPPALQERARPSPEIVGAVCILTPTAKELGQKRLEGKLAKRFGSIIIAVLLFWMPLVLCLILGSCAAARPEDWMFRELQTSALVLTCVPAALHPLIYSLLNRQFRAEFHRTLAALRSCRRRRD
ncbi:alpha-1A adrenergic receptor-like [Sardina pilchardus]|uniref:alpha-1A adrenergic receptor-like n=1 Tax=Sardina pilchardus TaxID=27697 RepID=UPI002E13B07E